MSTVPVPVLLTELHSGHDDYSLAGSSSASEHEVRWFNSQHRHFFFCENDSKVLDFPAGSR